MRTNVLTLLALVVLSVGGCVGPTAIKNVVLPPVTMIQGTISNLDEHGFTLTDSSGSILVRAKFPDNQKRNLTAHEQVSVYGNLQGGQDRVFDGYVITKATQEQIVVSNPSPHFGFIIQSAFK